MITLVAGTVQGITEDDLVTGISFLTVEPVDAEVIGIVEAAPVPSILNAVERTSLEMVVGSLQRNLDRSLKESPSFKERSMYSLSSRVRCFWFPGISLDIMYLLYHCQDNSKDDTINPYEN